MNDSNDFLKFLINEDVYIIDQKSEEKVTEVLSENKPEKTKENEPSSVAEPVEELEAPEMPKNEILVIFDNPSAVELPAADFEYLGKILVAIGKSTDKVDFLNVAQNVTNVNGYAQVIAFTPNHKLPVPVSIQQYVAVKLEGAQLIVADALNNISASTDLRKKLWGVLQQVFAK